MIGTNRSLSINCFKYLNMYLKKYINVVEELVGKVLN